MDERRLLFEQYLNLENKEKAVSYCIELLKEKKTDVVSLYETILTPGLNQQVCGEADQQICIWKEHIKTAIVRTIVECSYPYVMEERKIKNTINKITAVIVCPSEEYHDLGARMVADFFTICGCNTIFVGSNTPFNNFFNALNRLRPEIVAISVSDYYNLVATKKMIEKIRSVMGYSVTIVAGGNAFENDRNKAVSLGADYFTQSFQDIEDIVKIEVTE